MTPRRRRRLAAGLAAFLLIGGGAGSARADAPLTPDREQARSWAQQELLRPEYQRERPSLIEQLVLWLRDRLAELPAPQGLPGTIGVAVVAALVVVAVIYLVWRTGATRRNGRPDRPEGLFAGSAMTAAQHRAAADAADAAADHDAAVLERFRALVRGLQERALLELQPGRTADEAARAAAGWLPDLGAELRAAAATFDDVRYGDLPGTPAASAGLKELDERVRHTRPALTPRSPTGSAVPR